MDTKEIGLRIQKARTIRNVTLDDIASDVGVAKSTIQRYEKGLIARPKIPVLHAIANSLKVNPAWIVLKSDDMEIPTIVIDHIAESATTQRLMTYIKYLNSYGKKEAEKRIEELTHIPIYTEPDHLRVQAAHERTDIEVTDEMRKHDDDIMSDENF